MSKRRSITILFHEITTHRRMEAYRIWHCAKVWEQMGIDVRIVKGPRARIAADILIPSVDVSVMPDEYRHLLTSAPVVLNRKVLDIRKRTYSRNLVSPTDDYDGPVIVKTNCNCGGLQEQLILKRQPFRRRLIQQCARAKNALRGLATRSSACEPAHMHGTEYPVYESKCCVPESVFMNPELVVERFLPEICGHLYCVRYYTFLGSEGVAVRLKSDNPLVKVGNSEEPEQIPVDERMVAVRRELGLDFGKLDYVVHNGEPVLLDVNTTPVLVSPSTPWKQAHTERLARGIAEWMPSLVV